MLVIAGNSIARAVFALFGELEQLALSSSAVLEENWCGDGSQCVSRC